MPIEVVVTADHIASGVPGDAENCAICQALKAAGCTDVGVMSDFDVRYTFGNVPMYETLPPAVVLIAKQIDNRERVGPFSFALPIPIPSTRG